MHQSRGAGAGDPPSLAVLAAKDHPSLGALFHPRRPDRDLPTTPKPRVPWLRQVERPGVIRAVDGAQPWGRGMLHLAPPHLHVTDAWSMQLLLLERARAIGRLGE